MMKFKTMLASVFVATGLFASSMALADAVAEGKKIAENRKKGNCLACHIMGDGKLPGNVGPPLISMKLRYSKKALYKQIWDATKKNRHVMMPPFGKHKILSDDEIKKVVEYVHTL